MILTKEQVDKRFNSPDNVANNLEKSRSIEIVIKDGVNNHVGRNGARNLSPEERIAIGVIAKTAGDDIAADIFGVSKSHANDLKNGSRNVSTGEEGGNLRIRDQQLTNAIQDRISKAKLTIQERAAEKLLGAIGLLEGDKLENATLKELTGVATAMSQIMRNASPQQSSEGSGGGEKVKITLHTGKPVSEEMFDTIEIGVNT